MLNKFCLNTNEYLQQCNLKDVVSFNSEKWVDINKLKKIVRQSFSDNAISSASDHISRNSELKNSNTWFKEGEECEILRAGSKGWQKGKIKISINLEFIPDEVEEDKSPLDDIRQADQSLNSEQ